MRKLILMAVATYLWRKFMAKGANASPGPSPLRNR